MSGATSIEWTNATWNPVRGCSRVSEGCRNCYAERQAVRQKANRYADLVRSTDDGPRWTGKVLTVPALLERPLRWRKPRRIFVNSMSDLFHEGVPDEFIDRAFAVMAQTPRHVFQILTKRPERMRTYASAFAGLSPHERTMRLVRSMYRGHPAEHHLVPLNSEDAGETDWPLPNVWLGVSVEDQQAADERIPLLLGTPAAVHFVSCEPLLGPVKLRWLLDEHGRRLIGARPGLDWIIVGGESGPRARPCDVAWIRSIVEECRAAGVPVFCKQLGTRPFVTTWSPGPLTDRQVDAYICEHGQEPDDVTEELELRDRKGGDSAEWPEDLRVREFPR